MNRKKEEIEADGEINDSIENVQEGISRVSGIGKVALAIPKAVKVPGNSPACRPHGVAGNARVIFRVLSVYLTQRLPLLLDLRREEGIEVVGRFKLAVPGPTIGDTSWDVGPMYGEPNWIRCPLRGQIQQWGGLDFSGRSDSYPALSRSFYGGR
jgi:hypothetical protein